MATKLLFGSVNDLLALGENVVAHKLLQLVWIGLEARNRFLLLLDRVLDVLVLIQDLVQNLSKKRFSLKMD